MKPNVKSVFIFVLITMIFSSKIFTSNAFAATKYVKPLATGNGASWASASGDLKGVLNNAVSGDVIWVAAGEYKLSNTDTFELKKSVKLYGGFPDNGSPDMLERNPALNITTLNGDNKASNVVTGGNGAMPNDTLIDGFVITGSNGTNGGGMNNNTSSPTVTNCTFRGNSATSGGGMRNNASSPVIINCTFSGNTTTTGGGGIYNVNSPSPVIINCTFSGNSATSTTSTSGGGAMRNSNSSPVIVNTIFWGNTITATANGRAIYNDNSNPNFINCVVTLGDIYNINGSKTMLSDTVTYNPQIISIDASGEIAKSADQVYIYKISNDTSPAIDKGLPVGTLISGDIKVPKTDQRGVARPQGSGADIGAYEYHVPTTGISLSKEKATIYIENTYLLSADLSPPGATSKNTAWASNNPSVATVDKGLVTAHTAGTAVINATDGGFSASCTITVTKLSVAASDENVPEIQTITIRDLVTVYLTPTVPTANLKPILPDGTPPEIEPATAADIPDIKTAAWKINGKFVESDLKIRSDGKIIVNSDTVINAAKELIDSSDIVYASSIPIFTAVIETPGNIAAAAFDLKGIELFADKPEEIKLLKLLSPSQCVLFTYKNVPSEFADGTFTLQARDNSLYSGIIENEITYRLVLFIKDGGEFDLDGIENKEVIDPAVLLKVKLNDTVGDNSGSNNANNNSNGNIVVINNSVNSSSSGCNTFFAPFALLLAFPLILKKRWRND